MDARMRQDLDRHITGNYGEDQFRSEHWEHPTAHEAFWETLHNPHIYAYDAADDGPEVLVISEINYRYPNKSYTGVAVTLELDVVTADLLLTTLAAKKMLRAA